MTTTCVIDGSYIRASDLDTKIIAFALEHSDFRLNVVTSWNGHSEASVFGRGKESLYSCVSDLTPEECEWLWEIADRAVDFLNEHIAVDLATELVYWVEDSCLWLGPVNDECDVCSEAGREYDPSRHDSQNCWSE